MVGRKYSWLAPLARLSSLCTSKAGEVVYSLAENKTDISTIALNVVSPQTALFYPTYSTNIYVLKDNLDKKLITIGFIQLFYMYYLKLAIYIYEQTESYKGFIFYLHEEELLYNDVHHSQLTL